jgi:NTE family protein
VARLNAFRFLVRAHLLGLVDCATRPVNPQVAKADPAASCRFETKVYTPDKKELVALALSGGGHARTAAAASVLPVVLSPVIFDDHGGSCGSAMPVWLQPLPGPTARRAGDPFAAPLA